MLEQQVNALPNQPVKKQGFYYSALTDEERLEYDQSLEVEGLDEEIALLRIKLKFEVHRDPRNISLIMRGVNSLERLVRTQFRIGKDKKGSLAERMGAVIRSFALSPEIVSGLAKNALSGK